MDSSRVRVAVAIVRLLFAATLLGLIRALYMEPCPLEAEEGTTELSTACIGIAPQDQVKWWYTSPSKGSNPISLGTCYPTQEPCVLKVGRFFNITRPRKDMSVLTIKNVNRDHHAGARVTCRTYYLSSLADSTSCRMKVIYEPQIVTLTVSGQIGTVTLNESVEGTTILCVARGYPLPNLTLYKDEEKVKTDGNADVVGWEAPRSSELKLVVPTHCESMAVYTCVAANRAGQQQATVTLNVRCPVRPLVPSQKLSYPEVSQDRNYTVGVIAFPHISSFRFLRMHRDSTTATVPEGRFHFTYTQTARLSRYACVIALNTMTMQDEGRYAVTIGNELGEFQFFFWVHFTHAPTSASWRNDATLAASIAVPIVVLVIVIAVVAFIVIRRRRSQHVCERRKKSVVYQAEYRHEAVQTGPSDGISTICSIANISDSSDYCSPDGSTTYPKQPVSLRGNDNNAFESDVQPEQTSHSAPKRDNLYPDQGASTA